MVSNKPHFLKAGKHTDTSLLVETDPKRWKPHSKVGETIVVLHKGTGKEIPLIILHGGSGTIHAFGPMRRRFDSGLWCIQVTPDTPLHSLDAQSQFYVKKIKEKQPRGPYRLAAFSATSMLLFAMARLFEGANDTVTQFSLIDHFPSTFIAPDIGFDPTPMLLCPNYDISTVFRVFMDRTMDALVGVYRRDGGGNVQKRIVVADELAKAYSVPETKISEFTDTSMRRVPQYMLTVFDFMVDLWLRDTSRTMLEALEKWMTGVQASVTVYIASYGLAGCVTLENKEVWGDYGVKRCFPGARVVHMTAGHFDILETDFLIQDLQDGYIRPVARL